MKKLLIFIVLFFFHSSFVFSIDKDTIFEKKNQKYLNYFIQDKKKQDPVLNSFFLFREGSSNLVDSSIFKKKFLSLLENNPFHFMSSYLAEEMIENSYWGNNEKKIQSFILKQDINSCPKKRLFNSLVESEKFFFDRYPSALSFLMKSKDRQWKFRILSKYLQENRFKVSYLNKKSWTRIFSQHSSLDHESIFKNNNFLSYTNLDSSINEEILSEIDSLSRKKFCTRGLGKIKSYFLNSYKVVDYKILGKISYKTVFCYPNKSSRFYLQKISDLEFIFFKSKKDRKYLEFKSALLQEINLNNNLKEFKFLLNEVKRLKSQFEISDYLSLVLPNIIKLKVFLKKDIFSDFVTLVSLPLTSYSAKIIKKYLLEIYEKHDFGNFTKFSNTLINAEFRKKKNDRHVNLLSFCLFWLGKKYFDQKIMGKTNEYWNPLKKDYPVSYYATLVNYFLKNHDKINFNENMMLKKSKVSESFDRLELSHIKAILTLLQKGLIADAVCELKEFEIEQDSVASQIFLTVLHYNSGDWLNTVRSFHKIPWSVKSILSFDHWELIYPLNYLNIIDEVSNKVKIDKSLILSVIRQESIFISHAKSPAGAYGLMQILPRTAKAEINLLSSKLLSHREKKSLKYKLKNINNLLNPKTNILLGSHYLSRLISRYNNFIYALSAYNAGPSSVNRWIKKSSTKDPLLFIENIPFNETRNYVKNIIKHYFFYESLLKNPKSWRKLPLVSNGFSMASF